MARMTRGYGNTTTTTQWQINGYHPGFDQALHEDKLDWRINRSKRIGTLLMNWFWNTIVAGGILLSGVMFAAVAVLIVAYTSNYIH